MMLQPDFPFIELKVDRELVMARGSSGPDQYFRRRIPLSSSLDSIRFQVCSWNLAILGERVRGGDFESIGHAGTRPRMGHRALNVSYARQTGKRAVTSRPATGGIRLARRPSLRYQGTHSTRAADVMKMMG
jgi:hypothetical protein